MTHQSYAAAAANGPTVAVNVAAATISSVVAASVASPSSATMKNLARNGKLSAAVASPAAMAGLTGNACLPPSTQDLHTAMTQKSPKKRDQNAADIGHGGTDAPVAVGHAATDASVPVASKLRYPSHRTTNVGGASSHPLAEVLMLILSSIPIWLPLLPRIHCK